MSIVNKFAFPWPCFGLVIVVLVGILSGCRSTKPKAYNLEVMLDEKLGTKSVEVNIVGINELEKSNWEQLAVDDYWGSKFYEDANKVVMKFGQGQPLSQKVSKKDPVWSTWFASGVNHLFMVGDIPGVLSSQPGASDPRVLILPLSKDCWKDKTIKIEINPSQVRPLSPIQCTE